MFLGVLPCGENDGEVRLRLAATHQGQNPQKPTTFDFPSHLLYEASGPPSPVDTFWFIAESILIAHIGTLFESHSRDHVDMSRSRTRLKKLNIDSEVTKRVRKSAPHFCESTPSGTRPTP